MKINVWKIMSEKCSSIFSEIITNNKLQKFTF